MGMLISIVTGVIALAGLCSYAEAVAEADERQREKDDDIEKRAVMREEKRLEREAIRAERTAEEQEAAELTEAQREVWLALVGLDLVLALKSPPMMLRGRLLDVCEDELRFDIGCEAALPIAFSDVTKVDVVEDAPSEDDAD